MDSVCVLLTKAVKSEADPYADTKVAEDNAAIDVRYAVCIVTLPSYVLVLSSSLICFSFSTA